MGIRTGKGDNGLTSVNGSGDISKSYVIFDVLGDLDELDAYLCLVLLNINERYKGYVVSLQKCLKTAMDCVSSPGHHKFKDEHCREIEAMIEVLEGSVPSEKGFFRPSNHETAGMLNICRTVARRAERNMVRFYDKTKSPDVFMLRFMNAASDLLFIMSLCVDKKYEK